MFNAPNALSLFRIAVLPVMVALFYFDHIAAATWANVILFALAGATDFFDGHIARSTGQTSVLGKFLDSSSDKILVGGVLMLLVAFDRLDGLWIIPAVVVFVREILISGLREFMALYNISVHVSKLGKWKTTIQMLFMGFLIAGERGYDLVPYAMEIGQYGFLAAMILTVVSGWEYAREGIKTMRNMDNKQS